MKIDFYVLGLLQFQIDEVVFRNDELEKINMELTRCLKKGQILDSNPQQCDGWSIYPLRINEVEIDSNKLKIDSAELGYYHHRVIVRFEFSVSETSKSKDADQTFKQLRNIRSKLKDEADTIIGYVQDQINDLTKKGQITKSGEVKFVYTYVLMIVDSKRKDICPFSDQTSSMCFDVIEPAYLFWRKKHMVRISIPSMLIYADKGMSDFLKRDVLNAIYQHCLYKWKVREQKFYKIKPLDDEIKPLNEEILTSLWTRMMDTMGGRAIDVSMMRLTTQTTLLAIAAIILAGFAIIPEILS